MGGATSHVLGGGLDPPHGKGDVWVGLFSPFTRSQIVMGPWSKFDTI